MSSYQYTIKGLLLGFALGTLIFSIILFLLIQIIQNMGLGGLIISGFVTPIFAIIIYPITLIGFVFAGSRADTKARQGDIKPAGAIFSTGIVGLLTALAVGVIVSFFAEGEYSHYYTIFSTAQSPIPGYFAYIKYIIPVLAVLIGFCIVRIIEIRTSTRFIYVLPLSILAIALIFLYQVRSNTAKQLQRQSRQVANTFEIKNFQDQKVEEDGYTYQEITADVSIPKDGRYFVFGGMAGSGDQKLKIDGSAIEAISYQNSGSYNLPAGRYQLSLLYNLKGYCNTLKSMPYDEVKINSLPETNEIRLTIRYTTETLIKDYPIPLKNFKLSDFYQQCQKPRFNYK